MGFLVLAQSEVSEIIHESEGVLTRFLDRYALTKVEIILLIVVVGLIVVLARRRNGK